MEQMARATLSSTQRTSSASLSGTGSPLAAHACRTRAGMSPGTANTGSVVSTSERNGGHARRLTEKLGQSHGPALTRPAPLDFPGSSSNPLRSSRTVPCLRSPARWRSWPCRLASVMTGSGQLEADERPRPAGHISEIVRQGGHGQDRRRRVVGRYGHHRRRRRHADAGGHGGQDLAVVLARALWPLQRCPGAGPGAGTTTRRTRRCERRPVGWSRRWSVPAAAARLASRPGGRGPSGGARRRRTLCCHARPVAGRWY